jgi:Tol biopolymer transport system component
MRLHVGHHPAGRQRRTASATCLAVVTVAAVLLVSSTNAAAQGARIPTPGPILYAWMEREFHSNIYVKMPDEPDARMVHDEPGLIYQAKWSPDGEYISFATNVPGGGPRDTLSVMKADGSALQRLVGDLNVERDPHAWGPGDREITYYDGGKDWDGNLWVIDVDDPQAPRKLSRGGGVFASPAWSPDRRQIAYSWSEDGRKMTIHVMDADGRNVTKIAKAEGFQPAWSRDGTEITYLGYSGQANDVYIVGARPGATPRNLTDAPYWKYTPVFLADGEWIAYGVSGDVHVISVDGRERHELGLRQGVPAVSQFDWHRPFRAVSAAGNLPLQWGSIKAAGN